MPSIAAVTHAFPNQYYSQEVMLAALRQHWAKGHSNLDRLERIHHSVGVHGRHLALPIEEYEGLENFEAKNSAWLRSALDLGETVICRLLEKAEMQPAEVSQLVFTTVTGIGVPSVDARLMNRIAFSPQLKRVPLFGLGCVAGAAGIARVADYLRGHPDEAAILLSIELCSLTIQPEDFSIANIISSGLFGDGTAAVLMVGDDHPRARTSRPRVIDSRSVFFPNSEQVMGWEVGDGGLKIVLSADVAQLAEAHVRPEVEALLGKYGLSIEDIKHWIAHPGGPKVIQALETGLGLDEHALDLSRESLAEVGNISSTSVLLILEETLSRFQPEPGTYGLLMAMGPGFCAELVLLRW
ncbi:MAG: type III polyketide synthase [Anaerolineae bacterium]